MLAERDGRRGSLALRWDPMDRVGTGKTRGGRVSIPHVEWMLRLMGMRGCGGVVRTGGLEGCGWQVGR